MFLSQILRFSTVFNKKLALIFLLIVFALGVVLRLYKHRDFLVFQIDQSRDAFLISSAVENIDNLPLMGPQSSGFTFDYPY